MFAGAVLALVLVVAVAVLSRNETGRMTVEEVAQALEQGDIAQGDELPGGRLPKPWMADAYPAADDTVSAVYVMRDDRHTVLLYHHDWGTLFGACTIKAPPDGGETWHFYDASLMAEHIRRVQQAR